MNGSTKLALVLALVGLILNWTGGGGVDVLPDVPAPSAELQSLVAPIGELVRKSESESKSKDENRNADAVTLAWFYWDFAAVIEGDAAGVVKTTAVVRTVNRDAVTLSLGGRIQPIAGLADAIDAALAKGIGETPGKIDVKPLDGPTRARLVAALRAVAWACLEAR